MIEKTGGLHRALGPAAAIAIVVGNVVGTGVFLKSRAIMCNVGSPGAALAIWIAAGLLSLAGVLTYAELSSMMPRAGGEYVYIGEAYGRRWGFVSGWTSYAVSYAASQAAKAAAFAIFLNVMSGGALDRNLLSFSIGRLHLSLGALQGITLAVLGAVTVVNLAAVSVTGRVAVFLTVMKVGLVAALGVGTFIFARGDWMHFAMTSAGGSCEGITSARGGLAGVGAAMLGALWAYDGWVNLPVLAGEVRNPGRNLPLGLFAGLAIVTTLYLLANIAYQYALTPTQIANVPAASSVASEAIRTFMGPVAARIVAAIMMISTLGSLHSGILAGARIPYAMSTDGVFLPALGRLNKARVPFISVITLA
ncbi:MAG TPA: amino acid permease, partial [Thermoanaerobaculia bacterium]|nr:amino acid permease [Thermoanaerobaculia bacterium]